MIILLLSKMKYNLTFIIKSSLKEADRKKLISRIKSIFDKAKITENIWGQKALAYPIKKEVSGVFINMIIESEKAIDNGFEKKILNDSNILRHLLIRVK